MKFLVCDDEYANRLLTKSHLQMMGIESDETSSGADALKLLREGTYDAVIIDHSGLELAKKISPWPPSIILTWEGFIKETEGGLKKRTPGYMVKPVIAEKLKDELVKIFGDKKLK